jgi:signal recognition particle receptor subunit beta
MAERNAERGEVDARIVYWGVEGAGKTTNLHAIHARLRPDHRGRLEQVPTRIDPTVCTERLPIELGEIAGVRTRIQIVAVPGASEHAPTRKQLLDRVDGVVLVVDARRERIDENVASFEELRGALAAYGRSLESVPLVVQYNKQDLSDPYVLEELHRKLVVRGAAVFEAVASEGTGVLQTLTTISKRVVRALRESAPPPVPPAPIASPPPPSPARFTPPPPAPPAPAALPVEIERAALAEPEEPEPALDARDAAVHRAQDLLDASWGDLGAGLGGELEVLDEEPDPDAWRIVAVEPAEIVGPRSLVLPLRVADADGRALRLRLTLSLDALPEK